VNGVGDAVVNIGPALAVAIVLLAVVAVLVNRRSGLATDTVVASVRAVVQLAALAGVLAVVVGRRAIPWLLQRVAATESPELFTLAVLACALGIAWAAALLFDISFAVSAFFAGVIMNESEVSRDAARRSLPFRDAFAVLFFVSVGMLFDPSLLTDATWPLLAVLLIIIIGKSLAAFLIVLAMRHPLMSALTVSASLAQIGEFSFILVSMGVSYGLLPMEGRDLVLAGAFLSIASNPLLFRLLAPVESWLRERPDLLRRLGAKDDQEID